MAAPVVELGDDPASPSAKMLSKRLCRIVFLSISTYPPGLSGQTDPPKAARDLLATMIGISVLAKVDTNHRKLLRAIDEALDALAAPSRRARAPQKRIAAVKRRH